MCEALAARGRLGLLPKIARAFNLLATRAEARNTITMKVARHADGKRALKDAARFFKDAGVKPDDVKINVQEHLIGGWRLEGRETLYDNSYKKHLLSVYNRITNA